MKSKALKVVAIHSPSGLHSHHHECFLGSLSFTWSIIGFAIMNSHIRVIFLFLSLGFGTYFLRCCFAEEGVNQEPARAESPENNDVSDTIEVKVESTVNRYELKRATSSVSHIEKDQIEKSGIHHVLDLDTYVPNLGIRQAGDDKGPFLFIRGLTNNSFGHHAVAVYVDDLPIPEIRSVFFDMLDAESVTVLRGPQPTTLGLNAENGAILIRTHEPSKEWQARLTSGYGNYDAQEFHGVISGPIAGETAQFSTSGFLTKRDGFMKSILRGSKFDHREVYGGRAKIRIQPVAPLEVILHGELTHSETGGQAVTDFSGDNPFKVAHNDRGKGEQDTYTGALKLRFDGQWFELSSISAFRRVDFDHQEADLDLSPNAFFTLIDEHEAKTFSQELKLRSKSGDSPWQWTSGVYFEDRTEEPNLGTQTDHTAFIQAPPPAGLGLPFNAPVRSLTQANIRTRTAAVFGEATRELSEKVDLVFGLRYQYTHVRMERWTPFEAPVNGTRFLTSPPLDEKTDTHALLPKLGILAQAAERVQVFAQIARGHRPRGFSFAANDPNLAHFETEYLYSAEVGVRTSWLDGRIDFDLACFYIHVDDYQVRRRAGLDFTVLPAERVRSTGFEAMVVARPLKGLELTGQASYSDARFMEFTDVSGEQFDGNRVLESRKYDFLLAAQYTHRTGVFGRLEFAGVGPYYYLEDNLKSQGAYELLNARLGYQARHFAVHLWGKNLLNRTYYHWASPRPGGVMGTTPGDPQTFGLTMTIKY